MAETKTYRAVAYIYTADFGDAEVTDIETLEEFESDPDNLDVAASDYEVSPDSLDPSVYKVTIEIQDEYDNVIDSFTQYNDR